MTARSLFRTTGRISGPELAPIDGLALRPALFARFHDLPALRYDYPLVLVDGAGDEPIRSLSHVVDGVLREVAPPGIEGERLRRIVLRVERDVRRALAAGAGGRLGARWDEAAAQIAERGDAAVRQDLAKARAALAIDGDLVDCDATAAARVVTHLWVAAYAAKARAMRGTIDGLIARLEDLVRADHLRSGEGRGAEALRAGIGRAHRDAFDFDVMARLLARPSGPSGMHQERRRRIAGVLEALRSQRFFLSDADPYSFVFDRIDTALATFRKRLPDAAALVRAIAVAELEAQGHYVEAIHDGYFARFDERSLAAEDLARFPDYLVRVDVPASRAEIIGALSSGVPLKIVTTTNDVVDETATAEPAPSLGAQLATTAMGLGDVFVVQAPSASLFRMRDALRGALAFRGPALVSTYAALVAASLPPYLVSAAALESRAFPAFSYDPAAGTDWAHRFALGPNPQPDATWPEHELAWADGGLRRSTARLPFTLADFLLCDPRHAAHYARIAAGDGDDGLPALDAAGRLHRVLADDRMRNAARRCADAWERLRELDALKRPVAAPPAAPAHAEPAETAAPAHAEPAGEAAPAAVSSDDPYIETPRCTSCNECTQINDRMFAYNENKQAYIKDLTAGTYRQLVEAAESCQVAIIHPGKPRDPNEPGLDELIVRAEAFR